MRNRWLSVILMLGLVLALSPLGAQADPYQPYDHQYYHHPHGNAYGWDRHRDFDHHREFCGPRQPRTYVQQVYAPPVAYMAPVAPIIGYQACPQPQPFYSQPGPQGLHGSVNFGF